jgi:hypothetical protein
LCWQFAWCRVLVHEHLDIVLSAPFSCRLANTTSGNRQQPEASISYLEDMERKDLEQFAATSSSTPQLVAKGRKTRSLQKPLAILK